MAQQHSLLWQIESNVIEDLEITKEVEEVFDSYDDEIRFDDIVLLLKALVANQSIRSIRFEGDFLGGLHPERRSELVRAVGSYLPSLQRIDLGDTPILVRDLCHLITNSESLRSLNLHDLVLQGQPEDFGALEADLLHHSSLKEFDMTECVAGIPGIDLTHIRNAGKRESVPTHYAIRPLSPLMAKKRLHAVARSA
eukprot:CAMPEP_0172355802 /NCGR_PEP_ID=MMETSP1060-20121228/197_1 /TAXON_ID=37318 /ORGANISM="Pseudo-nitzschia pungens, Strain cf. cingulata" /LENGTH=195 /DNA_ID=CAMNT_0013075651 /DNA_START=90 /DNA_END=677 /DNA_ORIENTATION=+